MAALATPGVYVEEVQKPDPIAGADTSSTALFLGPTQSGPAGTPLRVTSWDSFKRRFGTDATGADQPYVKGSFLTHAVRGFFENGGREAFVYRVSNARARQWTLLVKQGSAGNAPTLGTMTITAALGRDASQWTAPTLTFTPGTSAQLGDPLEVTPPTGKQFVVPVSSASFMVGDRVRISAELGQDKPSTIATVTKREVLGGNVRISVDALPTPPIGVGVDWFIARAPLSASAATLNLSFRVDPAVLQGQTDPEARWKPGDLLKIENNGTLLGVVLLQAVSRTTGQVEVKADMLGSRTIPLEGATATKTALNVSVLRGPQASTFSDLSLDEETTRFLGRQSDVFLSLAFAFNPNGGLKDLNVPQPPVLPSAQTATQSQATVPDDLQTLGFNEYKAAFEGLADFEDANLLVVPDAARLDKTSGLYNEIVRFCEAGRRMFALLDVHESALDAEDPDEAALSVLDSYCRSEEGGYAALYYPWISLPDPTAPADAPRSVRVPSAGHIAGLIARVDAAPGGGVHKAPANEALRGALGVTDALGDNRQGRLNIEGLNVLRVFPGSGRVIVWGARTTAPKERTTFRYISTRRLFIYLKLSLEQGLRSSVFKPNEPKLWAQISRILTGFLRTVWESGALFGANEAEAFFVKVDESNNPEETRALGILNVEIGIKPAYPAEFIVVRFGIWDGKVQTVDG